MSIVGHVYLERGQPVTVLIQWSAAGVPFPGVTTRPNAPRNVCIERADGSRVVRPFRGLRRIKDGASQ